MAKKAVVSKPQLVHIKSPEAGSSALSKAQREFNRLTKRIVQAEKDVAAYRTAATAMRQRVQSEYRPLQARHNTARADLVRQLDHAHDHYKITKGERRKIVDLIGSACYDLLERGHPELQPIMDKYAPPLTAEEEAEADKEISEVMKELFSEQFGIEFDPAADVSTQEKFQAYVAQQMAEQQDRQAQEKTQATERRAKRKKSPKQQAAEDQKQAEEKNITKSVRALYMDLVKALHPDREPDEAEKLRKTELLKQVTTAYRANELLTLLRLQLDLQRIDQSHLENLAEDQLRHYNKLLKEQVRELDEALYQEQLDWSGFTGKPYFFTSTPTAMEYDHQAQMRQLNLKIRVLEAQVLAFGHDPAALKMFLKTYRIPKPEDGPLFG